MTVQEKIIERVKGISNPKLLDEILRLISAETEINKVYEFSKEETKMVNEGIDDLENGKLYSQNESDLIFEKWLKEKSNGH